MHIGSTLAETGRLPPPYGVYMNTFPRQVTEKHLAPKQALRGFHTVWADGNRHCYHFCSVGRSVSICTGAEITISYRHNLHVTKRADAVAQQVQKIPRCVISSHGLSCFQEHSSDGRDKSLPVTSLMWRSQQKCLHQNGFVIALVSKKHRRKYRYSCMSCPTFLHILVR